MQRHPGSELVAEVVDEERSEIGLDQPGGDADHPGRAEFGSELAGHVDQRCLGEVVDAEATTVGSQTADRRDVDDRARPILECVLPRGLAPPHRGFEIDLEGLVVSTLVDIEQAPVVRVGGGVVDQDVEAAETFDRGAHGPLPGIEVAGVCREDLDLAVHVGSRSVQLILLAAVDHHLGARCGERRCDRLSDALRGAGDQRDLAVE